MTVNDEFKNNESKESSDNSYWEIYFESETVTMDVLRKRWSDMAGKSSDRKKQSTNQRLDESENKQKKIPDGYIFDR